MCSITIWSTKANASCRIDCTLVKQQEEERKYWRDVLKCVVETIKFLAQRGLRGLSFQGSRQETIGSNSNGTTCT